MAEMKRIQVATSNKAPPTRDLPQNHSVPDNLPKAQQTKVSPASNGTHDAALYFIGTATTVLEWEGVRILTDPNFLHAGDHVHLGPGVTAKRLTNPAVDLHDLPNIDLILLSHYHEDHFDRKVEDSLRRDLPIITTPHAKSCLESKGAADSFTAVHDLDFYQSIMLDIVKHDGISQDGPAIKVTGMPGKHVPPGPLSLANDILKAVPPTNGWMLELGHMKSETEFDSDYRIYISGDTLMVDELKEIPERYKGQNIDLMLIHLGGTTLPSPSVPLLMVTMDATQGVELMRLINPDITIPIHYDDYDVFLSPLSDFKKAVDDAGLTHKVIYLDRMDEYRFLVPS